MLENYSANPDQESNYPSIDAVLYATTDAILRRLGADTATTAQNFLDIRYGDEVEHVLQDATGIAWETGWHDLDEVLAEAGAITRRYAVEVASVGEDLSPDQGLDPTIADQAEQYLKQQG